MSDTPIFLTRQLSSAEYGDTRLLDYVRDTTEGETRFHAYFGKGVSTDKISAPEGAKLTSTVGVGSALIVEGTEANIKARVPFDGHPKIKPSPVETDLFESLNTLCAVRNGENFQSVVDWLTYHALHHGAQAALIFDRAKPNSQTRFEKRLAKKIADIPQLRRVVIVYAPIAMGMRDLPAEQHPYCAPDAPGKSRMEIPKGDPWTSPLDEHVIYEVARTRFLAKARAVANIDIYDVLAAPSGPTIFDRALKSKSGVIPLKGSHCYPWRVRKNKAPRFADHICVQFDSKTEKNRWCLAPSKVDPSCIWRIIRVVGAELDPADIQRFYRMMNVRHDVDNVSLIAPKTSLIEDDDLLTFGEKFFDANPVRSPDEKFRRNKNKTTNDTAIVTTMKNEGPFILEWLAYHRAIGIDRFLVYTNDCDDGTDTLLDLLQSKGLVQHRDNPFKKSKVDIKPQHAALQASEKEKIITDADWVICMDVDEYISVHCGDHTMDALYKATGDANMISMTWRLFGNADIHEYKDELITEAFTKCARREANKPHQAWGFKTLFRQLGIFKKFGVHRPKGLKPQLKDHIRWVNGSGKNMPAKDYRSAWRSTSSTYGYDLVTLNHYAVRSAESFLVKRDRGRVNHVDRDQGLAYWFRMNNNEMTDTSIHAALPLLKAEFAKLMADPEIKAQHEACVAAHKAKIKSLRKTSNFSSFFEEITGSRMQKLSRLHKHFGSNIFLAGPEVIPQQVVDAKLSDKYFFTVEKVEGKH